MPFCAKCQRSFEGGVCPVCGTPIGAASSYLATANRLRLLRFPAAVVGAIAIFFAETKYPSPDDDSFTLVAAFALFFVVITARTEFQRSNFSESMQRALATAATWIAVALAAFGLVIFANGALDRATVRTLDVRVTSKHSGGGRGGPTYSLDVSPSWRPGHGGETLEVDYLTYERVDVGSAVSVDVHPGYFHFSWYDNVTPRRTVAALYLRSDILAGD